MAAAGQQVLQAGCNYQFAGGFVVGIQGDYDWANAGFSRDTRGFFFNNPSTIDFRVKSVASVTGRIGYAWDRFLGYVKGGGAWERDEHRRLFQHGRDRIAERRLAAVGRSASAVNTPSPIGSPASSSTIITTSAPATSSASKSLLRQHFQLLTSRKPRACSRLASMRVGAGAARSSAGTETTHFFERGRGKTSGSRCSLRTSSPWRRFSLRPT